MCKEWTVTLQTSSDGRMRFRYTQGGGIRFKCQRWWWRAARHRHIFQEDCLRQFAPRTNAGFYFTCEPRTPAPSELEQGLEQKWGC
jgi:hypothetical protein